MTCHCRICTTVLGSKQFDLDFVIVVPAEVICSLNVHLQLLIEERESEKKNNHRELTYLNLITGFSSPLQSWPVRLSPGDFGFLG